MNKLAEREKHVPILPPAGSRRLYGVSLKTIKDRRGHATMPTILGMLLVMVPTVSAIGPMMQTGTIYQWGPIGSMLGMVPFVVLWMLNCAAVFARNTVHHGRNLLLMLLAAVAIACAGTFLTQAAGNNHVPAGNPSVLYGFATGLAVSMWFMVLILIIQVVVHAVMKRMPNRKPSLSELGILLLSTAVVFPVGTLMIARELMLPTVIGASATAFTMWVGFPIYALFLLYAMCYSWS